MGISDCDIAGETALPLGLSLLEGIRVTDGRDFGDGGIFEGIGVLGAAAGAHSSGTRVHNTGLSVVSIRGDGVLGEGSLVFDCDGEFDDVGEGNGAHSSGMRTQTFGFKVGLLGEVTEVGTGFSVGTFVLRRIGADGLIRRTGDGILGSSVGPFVLPNVGTDSGEAALGEEIGDVVGPIASVGDFVLPKVGVFDVTIVGDDTPASSVGTLVLPVVPEGRGSEMLGEPVGAHKAGMSRHTVGLDCDSAGDTEGNPAINEGISVFPNVGADGDKGAGPEPRVGSLVPTKDGLNVGAARLGAHKSGIRMQRDGFDALSVGEIGR